MRATQLVYRAAGSPWLTETSPTVTGCRLCGDTTLPGRPWESWVKHTFTDHDKLQPGSAICAACLFCADDHSSILQQRTARDKLQRMRNYSHVVTADGSWLPLMKNQKRAIAAALFASPRVAVISLAGQKHLLFRAPLGWWQIEEQAMHPDPARLAQLLPPVEALYAAGASKREIETGHYTAPTLARIGLATWQPIELAIRPVRGALVFVLAVWLAQKETDGPDL